MVGNAALRVVEGPDAIGAVAAADQGLASAGFGGVLRLDFAILQARRQYAHRLGAVAVLGAVVLAFDHEPGRQMGNADRGVGLVDVLAAGARRTEGVDAQVGRVDVDFADLVGFRHHGDGAGRGVVVSLCFGFRNAMHAMAARFELQPRVGALPNDAEDYLLVAPDFAGVFRHDLNLPALALGIARVHAQQVAGEQRRLVTARAGADFQEDVALVVGIFRQ